MTAKQTIPPAPAATDPGPWNLLVDVGRQQMALGTESACALFRGTEAMRRIQQHAAHQALARHEAVMQKLHQATGPSELAALQSELLQFDLQGATRYWQQLGTVALQTQVDMMGCASHVLDNAEEGPFKSVFDAWQSNMTQAMQRMGAPVAA